MDSEKTAEIKKYIQAIIDDNDIDVLGKRAVFNTAANVKISTIAGVLSIPADEEIIIFFDDSLTGSGKAGLVISSWGLRYKTGIPGGTDGKWNLSWEELCENYTLYSEGVVFKKIVFRKGKGGLFTAEKKIDISEATADSEWLKRIIKASCKIFSGKDLPTPETQSAADSAPVKSSVPEHNTSPAAELVDGTENTENQEPTAAQKAQMERWHKEDQRDYNEARDYYEKHKSGGGSSFLLDNIAGVIMAVVCVILADIGNMSNSYMSGGQKLVFILSNIVLIPLSFVGYLVGNALRKALHPDFVIASGFWGLLKERIFWRIGPQLIGAFITAFLAGGAISTLLTE
jgi:hypothetical protein